MIEVNEGLIKAAKTGDEDAKSQITALLKKSVETYAQKYYLVGGEREDLIQEGYLGLSNAINAYDGDKGNFAAFALACVKNQMINSVKNSLTGKHKALNEGVPLEDASAGENSLKADSPETRYIQNESCDDLFDSIERELSAFEKEVLLLRLKELNYKEIAEKTGKSEKAVDNALARARKKLAVAIKERKI